MNRLQNKQVFLPEEKHRQPLEMKANVNAYGFEKIQAFYRIWTWLNDVMTLVTQISYEY